MFKVHVIIRQCNLGQYKNRRGYPTLDSHSRCYIIDFIAHVSSHFLQSTVHCSCLILFPSVHTSLFMLHLISSSPDFIDHVSSHSLQSTVHSIHLIYHSPSDSHLTYLFVLILHSHPTLCHFHFSANPFCGNKRTRGVFLDKVLITNVYSLLEAELLWFLLLLVSLFQRTNTALESFCRVLFQGPTQRSCTLGPVFLSLTFPVYTFIARENLVYALHRTFCF